MISGRERERSLLLFLKEDVKKIMAQQDHLTKIQLFVEEFIQRWPEVFLVDLSVSASNKITVLLDADNGMDVGRCADLNRALYRYVEEQNFFEGGNFSMEISSPGIDRPLKLSRQFTKNLGRTVEVTLNDSSVIIGKLVANEEDHLTIEKEVKEKKKEAEMVAQTIPFSDIRQVKVMVVF